MADDLPPRFTTELEAALEVPALTTPSDQRSTSSSARQRRWDDPPEDEPAGPPENLTSMVFIRSGVIRSISEREIMHLTFTPPDSHLAAMVPKWSNLRSHSDDTPLDLAVWSATTGQRVPMPASSAHSGVRVNGGFAFKPGVADLVVACPFLHMYNNSPTEYETNRALTPRLDVWDLGRKQKLVKQDAPVRAPVAWSADGEVLAGVSVRDRSRIIVVRVPKTKDAPVKLALVSMNHDDVVTKLAFLPEWEEGGRALVSAGRDGYVRVTSVETGRTLKKIEIGARAPASIMQVSGDGKLVVTVWGRDVVLWYLETGRVHNYNLNTIRVNEGWPLAVSADCRYLACRNEEGFDVMDVQTGKFRGEFAWTGAPITSAAFNSDGTRLAIGDYGGTLQVFEMVTS